MHVSQHGDSKIKIRVVRFRLNPVCKCSRWEFYIQVFESSTNVNVPKLPKCFCFSSPVGAWLPRGHTFRSAVECLYGPEIGKRSESRDGIATSPFCAMCPCKDINIRVEYPDWFVFSLSQTAAGMNPLLIPDSCRTKGIHPPGTSREEPSDLGILLTEGRSESSEHKHL